MSDVTSDSIYGTLKCAFPFVTGVTTVPPYATLPGATIYKYSDSVVTLAAQLTAGTSASITVEQSNDLVTWSPVATITLDTLNQIVYSSKIILTQNYLRFTPTAMSATAVYEIYGSGD